MKVPKQVMISIGEVGYDWIKIAFPRTNAYRNMCADGDAITDHFTSKGKSCPTHYFPWEAYGVGACINAGSFIELGYANEKNLKTLLAEGAAALKSELLEPIKPKIQELQEKEFVDLEGMTLLMPKSHYLVAPVKRPPRYLPGPLDILYDFSNGNNFLFVKSLDYLAKKLEKTETGYEMYQKELKALEIVQTAASLPRQIGLGTYKNYLPSCEKSHECCISCEHLGDGIEGLKKAYEFDTKTFDDIMGSTRYVEVLHSTIDGPDIDTRR